MANPYNPFATLCVTILLSLAASAQQSSPALSAAAALPDAPSVSTLQASPVESSAAAVEQPGTVRAHDRYDRIIDPGVIASPQTSSEKMISVARWRVDPWTFATPLLSAGWSHLRDSAPHYGTDRGAFGERYGAALLMQTTNTLFNEGIYASAFHEDPRYYVLGSGHSVIRRAFYAATRTFVTRTDDGNATVNYATIAGIATSTAITNAYYPTRDRTVGQNAENFAETIGSNAFGNLFAEFARPLVKRFSRD